MTRERWLHLAALVPAYLVLVPLGVFGVWMGASLALRALVHGEPAGWALLTLLLGGLGLLCLGGLARTELAWAQDATAARGQLRQARFVAAFGTLLAAALLAWGLVYGAWNRLGEDVAFIYAYVAPAAVGWRQVVRLHRLASSPAPQVV